MQERSSHVLMLRPQKCADVRVVDEGHELPNLPAADVAEAIQRRYLRYIMRKIMCQIYLRNQILPLSPKVPVGLLYSDRFEENWRGDHLQTHAHPIPQPAVNNLSSILWVISPYAGLALTSLTRRPSTHPVSGGGDAVMRKVEDEEVEQMGSDSDGQQAEAPLSSSKTAIEAFQARAE
ncbi:hypothetical protein BDV93DRAFT_510288 [Ceratobasidium sp. AG-I]|nr:hypothetical protein BDV93DRAFT_510288 [Ceratobasidium sp. AG-I]